MNNSLKKPTPRSKLRGIYGFLPFGTGRRPTRCFLGTLQRAAGNDQVQPEVTSKMRGEPIIQFSVYADNKVGRLNDLIAILSRRDVHIVALCTQDTTDSTLIRFVVDDPETARASLKGSGYSFSENALIAVEINGAMQLRAVTAALLEAEINIHYIYSFISRPNNRPSFGDCSAETSKRQAREAVLSLRSVVRHPG